MRRNLEVYQGRLQVLGPVFVGSGSEISKKEYLFLNQGRKVGIIDIQKFYAMICRKGLERAFEGFLMGGYQRDLTDWIRNQHGQLGSQDIKTCLKYVMDSGDTAVNRKTPLQIMECIKDPYGLPYIPGSSIKGMLRTILLGSRILESSEYFSRRKAAFLSAVENADGRARRKTFLQKEMKQIEETGFHTLNRSEKTGDAVNDELAGLIVSDSEPLKLTDLVLCQKIERHVDGTEKKLNVLRECLKPETEIRFTITVETDICSVRREEIIRAAENFQEAYYDNFLRAFSGMDRPVPGQVYLGGGTGFATKTVIYPLLGKKEGLRTTVQIFKTTGVPLLHRHNRDFQYGVSPHIVKCTRYQGRTMEMGRCRLKLL